MLGRPKINAAVPFRASVADAAFAIEERLVWRGADLLRRLGEVARWPFERAVWTVERGVVWPLEERSDGWSESVRMASAAGLVTLAAAAAALGLLLASGGGQATRLGELSTAAVEPAPIIAEAPPAPVLHGSAPDFTPEGGDAAVKTAGSGATAGPSEASSAATADAKTASSAASDEVVDPGKAAIAVARRFSGAFVLYETGQVDAKVRATIAATASPQVTRDLLRRPPRLPANVTVPKAKVLNVVPGPKHGDVYTLSVSLLRVGITSELRLGVQREKGTDKWQVTETLG